MSERYGLSGGVFRMEGFDTLPPFSGFLPGIAGVRGIPLWAFYCNRGQGVHSFGVHHKGNAIMEFNPANVAYENVAIKGFRTFLRVGGEFAEPFSPLDEARRVMEIGMNALTIREENERLGYAIRVTYFILPNAPLGAVVRRVSVEDTGGKIRRFELLDGMPRIIPWGLQLGAFKEMSNLLKSFTNITNLEQNAPLYAMRSSSDDSAEVKDVEGGYFYLTALNGVLQPVVIDPDAVFAHDTSLQRPEAFTKGGISAVLAQEQCFYNKLPCAFTPISRTLAAGERLCFDTAIGFSASESLLNGMLPEMTEIGYFEQKEKEARALTDALTDDVATRSGSPAFDAYLRQSYLDNLLRGGYPYVFENPERPCVVHLFSRKHGDPERDYNFFSTAGEYYSQGNGNFRDVCQNRRNDVRFHPEVGDFNVYNFLSLIQMDGYNPLEIRPSTFVIAEDRLEKAKALLNKHVENGAEALLPVVSEPFTPGMVCNRIAAHGLRVTGDEEALVRGLLAEASQRVEAGYGEGYWSDHFDYCLDLIEDYLAVFPDRREALLFGRDDYRFYDSAAVVRPRRDTVVLAKRGVRQYGAVYLDPEKLARPGFDPSGTNWQKDARGRFVTTNLFGKLFTLAVTKCALLDPEGMGIEMDGGKPGWCDAMNGLPGLMGSGMPETLELRRLLDAMLDVCPQTDSLRIPEELAAFARDLAAIECTNPFSRRQKAADLREAYRERVRLCTSGEYARLPYAEVRGMLETFLVRVEAGVEKANAIGGGVTPTYFTYEATEWEPILDASGNPVISPYGLPSVAVKALACHPLPLFLEGPARMLAASREGERAGMAALARKLRQSGLYDQKLRMFRTSESLEAISMENGRIRAFTPGWLERESVFLHMEYKYFMGLFKAGLYDEFFACVRDALIPFLNPATYGRSNLENVSFIASSANPDVKTHGRGYVARLSGSTAEAISMWLSMFAGKGFSREGGELVYRFAPILPPWWFDVRGEACFTLLSRTRVTYANPAHRATYGENAAKVREITCRFADGSERKTSGDALRGADAEALRSGEILSIDASLS